jgi:hypothetical protein
MVTYQSSDIIPMSEFEYAWRITDAKWSSLPEETLRRIKPMGARRSKQLFESSPLCGGPGWPYPFDPASYHATRQLSLEAEDAPANERIREQGKQWYRRLPIAPENEVYLCWAVGEGVAAVTDWHTFTDVWDDLWYPFDRMCVFDDSRDWALLLGMEEYAVFIERGPVDPLLPKSDPTYGMCLVFPTNPSRT